MTKVIAVLYLFIASFVASNSYAGGPGYCYGPGKVKGVYSSFINTDNNVYNNIAAIKMAPPDNRVFQFREQDGVDAEARRNIVSMALTATIADKDLWVFCKDIDDIRTGLSVYVGY